MGLLIAIIVSASLVLGIPGTMDLNGIRASRDQSARQAVSHATRDSSCMSKDEAQQVATNFKYLIVEYSDSLAVSSLTEDFVDYSDSVLELINSGCTDSVQALGTATFDSREAFMEGQSAQPSIPWQQLNIWHTCSSVTVRWLSKGEGQEPQQVTGIVVLETVHSDGSWLIKTAFSEFNSGAWMVNIGLFEPECDA